MSKMHISLNVVDLDAAVDFYRRFLGAEPAKQRPGYANFDVEDPPLKLALNAAKTTGLSHLGVQVSESETVLAAMDRFKDSGLDPSTELDTNCCHALQDKVWVQDPDGYSWEVFVVKADLDSTHDGPSANTASSCLGRTKQSKAGCCA